MFYPNQGYRVHRNRPEEIISHVKLLGKKGGLNKNSELVALMAWCSVSSLRPGTLGLACVPALLSPWCPWPWAPPLEQAGSPTWGPPLSVSERPAAPREGP